MIKQKYFNRMARIGLCFSALLALSSLAFSQVDTSFNRINLSYTDYLSMVVRGNLEYAVEKYSINIADAKIEAAKVFQNPSLAFDWSRDEENYSLSAEISKTFELGQKRKARINLAKSERSVANAMLLDYLRNLQADATLDYLAALKQNYLFRVMLNSYQTMKELSDGDSVRFSLGSINAIDATQSKIEAGVLRNDLFQIEVERNNSFINLSTKTGTYISDTLFFPVGKFEMTRRHFAIDELLTNALNSRADLLAAKSNLTYNQNSLILTRRERMMDIDLKTGTKNSYLNTGSSSPNATEIFAGIAIPLKFSNFNKGEIKIAKFQIEQGELLYKKVEMKIQTEVLQAYNQYTSLCKQVGSYNQGLLDQAKMVLNGKMYSYSRGETSLLEVLNAQRTYNDLQTAYYETLYKCNEALVELERAAGIWDIEL